ncbi:hypothetical protein ACFQHN_20590 [Natrialbaceae archaeon GCM10025896]
MIVHVGALVHPSSRGKYEHSEAIDVLSQSGRTIDAIRHPSRRIDVGYPEDRDEAEARLREQTSAETVVAEDD